MSRARAFEIDLRCPDCGAEEITYERDALLISRALSVRGGVLTLSSEPTAVAFEDVHLLCSVCEAELAGFDWTSEAQMRLPDTEAVARRRDLFRFQQVVARAAISNPTGAIWPVNSFSDADELNSLFEAAVQSGVIARSDPNGFIHIYPLSISEPEAVLAVNRTAGPSLLGYSLKLRERDGENPLEFTLRLLEETVREANALIGDLESSG